MTDKQRLLRSEHLYCDDCYGCKVIDMCLCPIHIDAVDGTGLFNIDNVCPWRAWFDNIDPENFRRVYRMQEGRNGERV